MWIMEMGSIKYTKRSRKLKTQSRCYVFPSSASYFSRMISCMILRNTASLRSGSFPSNSICRYFIKSIKTSLNVTSYMNSPERSLTGVFLTFCRIANPSGYLLFAILIKRSRCALYSSSVKRSAMSLIRSKLISKDSI